MLFNVIFKKFTKLKSYIHICAKKQVLSSDQVPHSIFFPPNYAFSFALAARKL